MNSLQKKQKPKASFLKGISIGLLSFLIFLGLSLISPSPINAASGGRMGGGSFRASPSIPRGGGFGGSYRGGGGYRGYGGSGIYRGYGGYGARGIGFPFVFPFFGFGGGLFGVLIVMTVAGLIANSLRGIRNYSEQANSQGIMPVPAKVTISQIQIGLLGTAKATQDDLRVLANSSDTSNSAGLKNILQETSLSLLRNSNLWVYANLENGQVPYSAAESTFNRLSIAERSKLDAELTSNFSGLQIKSPKALEKLGSPDPSNEYIAITILVASNCSINFPENKSSENLKIALQQLGAITSRDLIALEIIWQPEGKDEILSAAELVTAYPNLVHL
tara:strand:- start:11527 stop:12525 length:999 start_codon:yes stop_codon:yes gene_type:complete